MRVVMDTNVLVSGLLKEGNEAKLIDLCFDEIISNFISVDILNELERTLGYKKFRLTNEEIEQFMYRVSTFSSIVNPEFKVDRIKKDPSDNMILECAIATNAQYIVSGDSHLLELKEVEGIEILKTKELLKVLDNIY